jgi:hypothetical protein
MVSESDGNGVREYRLESDIATVMVFESNGYGVREYRTSEAEDARHQHRARHRCHTGVTLLLHHTPRAGRARSSSLRCQSNGYGVKVTDMVLEKNGYGVRDNGYGARDNGYAVREEGSWC